MRSITIDVPFGLTFTLHTRVPGRLTLHEYRGGESSSPRSSEPIASSSSENMGPELTIEVSSEDISNSYPIERPDSRSSQRTLPWYDEVWRFEDWESYYEEQGIKIRDFALEPPSKHRATTIFDPCLPFYRFQQMIKLDLWEVWHLYDMKWITEEQARGFTQAKDWPSLKDKSLRLHEAPWEPLNVEKPTGTRDEIVEILRAHIKRRYYINSPDKNGDSKDGAVQPVALGPHLDAENISPVPPGSSNQLYAPVAIKRSHIIDNSTEDNPDEEAREFSPSQKRQKTLDGNASLRPTSSQGAVTENDLLSATGPYPSLLRTPSPSSIMATATTAGGSNQISGSTEIHPPAVAANGHPTVLTPPPQQKSRRLARTETLTGF